MQTLLDGGELEFAYESVRLYLLCEGMKWAHLPVDGGIYAQHPQLLDEWQVLFEVRGAHEKREAAQREREASQKSKHPRIN